MVPIRSALALGLILVLGHRAALGAPVAMKPGQATTFEKGFSAIQQGTKTFQAQLRQTLTLQGVSKPIVSLGTLYYESPDRLLIRFSQPAGEWMLVNGSQMALQKQGQPLQRRDLSAQASGKVPSHAASLLDFFHSGSSRWHQDFAVTMTRDGDLVFVHLKPYLTPTAPSQGVDHIVTTLKLPNYDLVEMEISFNAANGIDYQFQSGRRNMPLDPTLFRMP